MFLNQFLFCRRFSANSGISKRWHFMPPEQFLVHPAVKFVRKLYGQTGVAKWLLWAHVRHPKKLNQFINTKIIKKAHLVKNCSV